MPNPIPIPWPNPPPGISVPIPITTPSPIAPGPVTTIPVPTAVAGGGFTAPFANLFKFALDWRFLGAFVLIALSVAYVEDAYPDYAYPYAGILLLGFILTSAAFGPEFSRLIGR